MHTHNLADWRVRPLLQRKSRVAEPQCGNEADLGADARRTPSMSTRADNATNEAL